ncbi:sensor histidine kinase [Nonomuraea fuscirosea]|uniref:sensor histidine kinase n=1 Tax=Nonomuraea fuscirosea TaxID=1291556 RepID=UPI00342FA905
MEWSIRARMMLLTTLVTLVLSVIVAWLVLDHRHRDETDLRLQIVYGANLEMVHRFAHRAPPPIIDVEGVAAAQLVHPDGRVVSATERVRGQPRMATFVPSHRPMAMDRRRCDVPGFPGRCMIVVAMWVPAAGADLIAYSVLPDPPWYGNEALLAQLVAALTIGLAVMALGTYYLIGRSLRPVKAMTAELAEITETDLAHRVPVPAHHDELRYLATIVNRTLELLEAAVHRERRFTTDASHDLRTPITGARLRLEEALMNPDAVDWPNMAKDLLGDVERQQAIAEDILILARLDADRPAQHERTDLAELVRAELRRRAPGRVPIRSDLRPGVFVTCDPLLISRLLTNLLNNAQRHAATGVTVAVRAEDGTGVLVVFDDGAGIAPEHRELVFERFARLPESRALDPKGTGLGLPICREIAQVHRGTLIIEDPGQGTCLVLRLPLVD